MDSASEESELLMLPQDFPTLTFVQSIKVIWPYRRDNLLILAMYALTETPYITLLVLLPLFLDMRFGLSDFTVNLALGIYGLILGLIGTYTVLLPMKIGHSVAMIIAGTVTGVGMLVLGVSGNLATIFLPLYTLIAAGTSLTEPMIFYTSMHCSPPNTRLLTNVLTSGAYYVSFMLISAVITLSWALLQDEFLGYFIVFGTAGVLGLAGALLVVALGEPQFSHTSASKLEQMTTYAEVFSDPHIYKFLGFLCLYTLSVSTSGVLPVIVPIFMVSELGEDTHWALVELIIAVASLVGIFILHPFLLKVSDYNMVVAGCIVQGLAVGILIIPLNYTVACIAATVYGLGNVGLPNLYDYVQTIAPKGHAHFYYSFCNFPVKGALLVKALLAGTLLTLFYPESGSDMTWLIWLILLLMSLLWSGLLWFLKSYLEIPRPDSY